MQNKNFSAQFSHSPLERINLKRIDSPKGRKYETPTGNRYESVTTFLSRFKPQGLIEWRERVGEEEANRISNQAAARGTIIHEMAENYLLNRDYEINDPILSPSFKRFRNFLDKIDNILGLEYNLYSDILKLAGTVDCIAEYEGVMSIIDFKTSSSPKQKSWIESYWLQTTIYSYMVEEMYGIKIPQLVIGICVDNDHPQIFVDQRKNWRDLLLKRINMRSMEQLLNNTGDLNE